MNSPASRSRPNSSPAKKRWSIPPALAFRPDVQGAGYWVFAPARLAGGSIVMIDRGFVPVDRKDPASRAQGAPHGTVDVVGVMRWPETRGMFTPDDEPQNNVWYLRDPKAMAAAKKWDSAAPFYIEQESPVPAGGLPKPGKLVRATARQPPAIRAHLVRPRARACRRLRDVAGRAACGASRDRFLVKAPAWR